MTILCCRHLNRLTNCLFGRFLLKLVCLLFVALISINYFFFRSLFMHGHYLEFQYTDRILKTYGVNYFHKSHILENRCRFWIDAPIDSTYKQFHNQITNDETTCSLEKQQIVEQLNDTKIIVHKHSNHNCFWRDLFNKTEDRWQKIQTFNVPFHVNADNFHVKCSNKKTNQTVFNSVFNGFTRKEGLTSNVIVENDALSFNVIVLVLDGMSQHRFLREMPRTLEFLRSSDVSFMRGFSNVDAKNDLNLMAMLTGQLYSNTRNVKSIFTEAKGQNFVTMFNEYKPNGVFKHFKDNSRIDYSYEPFYMHLNNQSRLECLDGLPKELYPLKIMERFSRKFARKTHFSFNSMQLSKNVALLDRQLSDTLKDLNLMDVWSHSAFFLIGNTGETLNNSSNSFSNYLAQIEQTSPLLMISLPTKYKDIYKKRHKNLKFNENRFVTFYDLHVTLLDILDSPKRTGKSLLKRHSATNTCKKKGISSDACSCWKPNLKPKRGLKRLDVSAILKSAMRPIEDTLKRRGCVSNYSFSKFNNFKVFTPPANNGYLNGKRNPHRIVEFSTVLKVVWDVGRTSKFRLRLRVNYNKKTRTGRLILKPLLNSSDCEERLLENICGCI